MSKPALTKAERKTLQEFQSSVEAIKAQEKGETRSDDIGLSKNLFVKALYFLVGYRISQCMVCCKCAPDCASLGPKKGFKLTKAECK